MKHALLFFWFVLLSPMLFAQKDLPQKFTPAQSMKVIDDAAQALNDFQPGTYRYHSKADLIRYRDSLKATVTDSLTELELYRKVKPMVSRIGCLHTGLAMDAAYKKELESKPLLFPFRLYFENDHAFIVKNFSGDTTLHPGDEITTINGRPMAALLALLLPAIPSDGYNQTMKYLALYHQFPTWYQSMIAVTDSFTVAGLKGGKPVQCKVGGALKKNIAGDGFLEEFNLSHQLTFDIKDSVGLLTVHSFSNSDIKKGGQRFNAFMDTAFATLRAKHVPYLVIDLRYNTGGSDDNAAKFAGYFFDSTFRYWDRIVVTPKIAAQIKGMASVWYRKPVLQDSEWLWQKSKTVHDFDYYEAQQPSPLHYQGKVYVLINGFCMSSCADVAAVLNYNKKALFVGEETGGGFQGNNSGMMPLANLKPSKMMITLPMQAYYMAVDPKMNVGHGTMPDFPVALHINEILENRDKVMEYTLKLIQAGR